MKKTGEKNSMSERTEEYMGEVGDQTRMLDIENVAQTNEIALLGRALNAPVRIEILRMLNKHPLILSEIAEKLDLPLSSAAFHMRVLEEAGLVSHQFSTKCKGTLKWYSYGSFKNLQIGLRASDGLDREELVPYTKQFAIGDYVEADLPNAVGIATDRDCIMDGRPSDAFIPERHNAQLIWFAECGSLTYAIPNTFAKKGVLAKIDISMELCAEAMGYNEDFPSDITFSMNGVELCTYTSPGDFGDRYGKFTPRWWFPESTKYGQLVKIGIQERGVLLNGKLVNRAIRIADLGLADGNRVLFKIEVKKDAEHKGGLNLFGDRFGDYNQAILFMASYKSSK